MRPIFCGNFEYDARQSDLERLFRRYGKVDRVDMKSGFAFIYMEDERDADDAIRGLDRTEFGRKGRRLRVEWTKHERGIRRPGGASRRPAANTRPSKTLFVINFDPYHTRTRDLERHFEPYGKIVSVRIRRNFAFVQYEAQEDATRALETTNMSKLMDRVISVEYAVRDDDDRRNGYSPERGRDRSPERGRRRSPSPYRRERGSPDYGRGSSRSPYRRERGSPDYGRVRSPSPSYRRDRGSPNYGRGTSQSPYRKERAGAEHGRGPSRSPYRRERASTENGRGSSRSPYRREKPSPENGRNPSRSPYGRERRSSENGRGGSRSPYGRERASPENGRASSPNLPDPRDSPGYGGGDSPINDRYRSGSPPAED
uniref:Serine/arginine-rich protein RS43a n=1 Tax=Dimocarpus longan TaxID=128017 RepID=A0A7S6AKM0_9ROSI|nr:serine/arginine-rich protein RS43a [Dimocarpus longan]QMX85230.1 serine/arginine-rich protein RS43b [Dimocarpus longan]QMX85231.1 serine/arginine-rich protein RS43c [Dimocarpus longan]